jgi:hypothetical protein
MVTKLKPSESKANWCRFYTHIRSLKLRHFKMVEAMGLKIMASRSLLMA